MSNKGIGIKGERFKLLHVSCNRKVLVMKCRIGCEMTTLYIKHIFDRKPDEDHNFNK